MSTSNGKCFVAGVPSFSVPARFDPDARNTIDIELTIQMVKDADSNCTEVNFNNIPVSSLESVHFASYLYLYWKVILCSGNPQVSIPGTSRGSEEQQSSYQVESSQYGHG